MQAQQQETMSYYPYLTHATASAQQGTRRDGRNPWSTRQLNDSFEDARRYAEHLLPGCNLDYIPAKEQTKKGWVDEKTYLDPVRGELEWCHSSPPLTTSALKRTRMYAMEGLIASNVDALVHGVRKQRQKQQEAARQAMLEWEKMQEVATRVNDELIRIAKLPPTSYWGPLGSLEVDDIYDLIANKEATKADLAIWVELYLSHRELNSLNESMGSLEVQGVPEIDYSDMPALLPPAADDASP